MHPCYRHFAPARNVDLPAATLLVDGQFYIHRAAGRIEEQDHVLYWCPLGKKPLVLGRVVGRAGGAGMVLIRIYSGWTPRNGKADCRTHIAVEPDAAIYGLWKARKALADTFIGNMNRQQHLEAIGCFVE